MADTPSTPTTPTPTKAPTFKVADVRASDVTLELEDGRVIVATVADGVDKDELKRGRMVAIKHDGVDKSDAPKDAVVTRLLPKD